MLVTGIENIEITQVPNPEELPVMSVCELFRDLPSYRGKRIAVRGEVGATMEGAWLSDHACESGFVTDGYRWTASVVLGSSVNYVSPSKVETEELIENARSRPLPRGSRRIETIVGVLRVRDDYFVHCRDGSLTAVGLGHLNGAAAELLVEKFLDQQPAPPLKEGPYDLPQQPCPQRKRLTAEECDVLDDFRKAAAGGCTEKAVKLAEGNRVAALAVFSAIRNWPEMGPSLRPVFERLDARLLEAILQNDIDYVEDLRATGYRTLKPEYLRAAVRYGDPKMVRLLIAKGMRVNELGPLGSPLHVAVLFERWDNLRTLLKAGADITIKDRDGRTPVAGYGLVSLKALQELQAAGVQINSPAHGPPSLLVRAITSGSPVPVVRALLEGGALAYAADSNGDSPLHHAVRSRRSEVIPILREFGAVIDHRNNAGETPLDIARKTTAFQEAVALTER